MSATLGRNPLFAGLTTASADFAARGALVKLARRRQLYLQGAQASDVFLLTAGRVRVSRASAERSLTVAYRGPGELVGESGLLCGCVYLDAATASDDVEAVRVPIVALKELMSADPGFAERMLHLMVERRMQAERRIEGLLVRSVESRVADFLVDAAGRYGVPDSRGVLIGAKYTHQEIGDYVGSTRETVTLTLGDFKRRGFIAFDHRRVVLLDKNALERVAA